MSLHRASHVRRCSSAALGLMALRTAHSLAAPPGSALATKLFYNDVYTVELPAGHKFPMEKYGAVRRKLQRLLGPGRLATFHESPLASRGDLGLAHCPTYVERYLNGSFTARENRVVGFPWSPASVNRALSSVGGTVAATHAVCRGECGIGGHLAGGTHHAFRDRGEGYCVFSDIAVAANVALRDYPHVKKILILDLDVHQGNGNAEIFKEDDRVFTFSVHCRKNIFSAPAVSDLDVELEEGCGDDEYLAAVAGPLTRILREERPDLVFFQAGVDPGVADRLGKLRLSPEGLRRRNRLVYGLVRGLFRLQASSSGRAPSGSGGDRRSRGGGVSRFGLEGEHGGGHGDEHGGMEEAAIPLVVTMGGGYPRNLDPTSSAFGATIQDHVDVYMDAARAAALPVGASLGWELECGVVLD